MESRIISVTCCTVACDSFFFFLDANQTLCLTAPGEDVGWDQQQRLCQVSVRCES
jgi:hypothetical protein